MNEQADQDRLSHRASMREVASLADVAISSVSRVLSGHPDVSPTMRQRVLAAVEQLGYEPDFLAQSLRRGATLSVGYVARDISTPLMASIAASAEWVLRGSGYSLVVMSSDDDPSLDAAHMRFFRSRRVDGMIVSLASERKRGPLEVLAEVRVPVVVLDRDVPARLRMSAVLSDHAVGMRAAIEYLLDLGHRRIALISGPLDVRPSRERLAGMREGFRARGLPDDIVVRTGRFNAEHGETAAAELLDGPEPPTAVVAGSSQLLVGCLRAFAARGIRPGQPVSLVSCDDVPLSELFQPPIAVVDRNAAEVGRIAAELLLRRMQGGAQPETVLLPTHFVPRSSCTPPQG